MSDLSRELSGPARDLPPALPRPRAGVAPGHGSSPVGAAGAGAAPAAGSAAAGTAAAGPAAAGPAATAGTAAAAGAAGTAAGAAGRAAEVRRSPAGHPPAAGGPAGNGPEEPLPPGLGEAVRAVRTQAGLTVEELSGRTKIRIGVLRDLEQGSTARSGGAAYARGHLRAIARATGSDPAVLLAAHERTHPGAAPLPAPTQVQTPLGALRPPAPARERRGPRWGPALAAAAGVLALLMVLGGLTDAQPAGEEPGGGRAAPAAPVAPAVPPAPPPAPPAPVAALRLEVTGDASWVDVLTEGGQTLFRGVLPAGTEREFSAPSRLSLTVGNAGAVTVACGGSDVPAGKRGQVRRYTCAPDGLTPA